MWRDKPAYWLVIGAQSIEAGVPAPGGGTWPAACSVARPITLDGEVNDPFEAMLRALDVVVGALASQPADKAGTPDRLRVLVSDRWIAAVSLPWSDSLARAATARAYAREHLGAAGSDIGADDVVRIEDAGYGALRTAIAYPQSLLTALGEAAARLGARLDSILPLATVVARQARERVRGRLDALVLIEPGFVSFMRGPTLTSMGAPVALVQASAVPEVARLWQRWQWRDASLGQARQLHVIDLRPGNRAAEWNAGGGMSLVQLPGSTGQAAETPLLAVASTCRGDVDLDGVLQRHPPKPVAMLVAVVAMVVAGAVVYHAGSVYLQAQARMHAMAAPVVAPASPRRAPADRQTQARMTAVNTAILQLNLPIFEMLRALPPPKDIRVALLSIEVSPPTLSPEKAGSEAKIKITAEAPTAPDMTRYVAFLAAPSRFRSAYLINHEVSETSPSKPFRFTVEGAWQE